MPPIDRLSRVAAIAGMVALLAAVPGCSDREIHEPGGPEAQALALFALARGDEPEPAELDRLFDTEPESARRAALLDALGELSDATAARVVGMQELPSLNRVAVDLAADLTGEGTANYSVQLELRDETTWKVVWFGGPDVEWPAARRRRGLGLTTRGPGNDPG